MKNMFIVSLLSLSVMCVASNNDNEKILHNRLQDLLREIKQCNESNFWHEIEKIKVSEVPQRIMFAAIFEASSCSDDKILRVLRRKGFNLDTREGEAGSETVLHLVAKFGHPEQIERLVNAGANIDAQDIFDGATPLIKAISSCRPEAATVLLKLNADTTLQDKNGYTAAEQKVYCRLSEDAKLIRDLEFRILKIQKQQEQQKVSNKN